MLESQPVPATERPTLWIDDSAGYRQVHTLDRGIIAADDQDCYARAARFAIEAGPLAGKSVAWIGGGFCVGPMAFAAAECKQAVYEAEPSLREFCPAGVTFIPGDWRDTLKGRYDVIVYDLGGEVPRDELAKFLAPSGKILPEAA